MMKSIEITSIKKANIFQLADKYILTLEKKTGVSALFLIPNFVRIKKVDKKLVFFQQNFKKKSFQNFYDFVENFIQQEEKIHTQTLILKGNGFLSNIINNGQKLSLKLGHSHLDEIEKPSKTMQLSTLKNTITISGSNKQKIGNFVHKLRNLKTPDPYKGKGIWYKNEIRNLKEIKKN